MKKYGVGHTMYDVARLEGEELEWAKEDYGDDAELPQCPFCAKAIVSDATLLTFALSELGVSREQLADRYKSAT